MLMMMTTMWELVEWLSHLALWDSENSSSLDPRRKRMRKKKLYRRRRRMMMRKRLQPMG